MKITRSQLKKIIIEQLDLDESPADQAQLDQLVHNREDQPYAAHRTHHREYEKEHWAKRREEEKLAGTSDEEIGELLFTDKDIDAQFDMRRDVKRFWNKNADHKFWQDPNQVIAIHDLSYYVDLSDFEDKKYSEELKGEVDLSIDGFLRNYPPGKLQRDEMSTYGFLSMDQFFNRSLIARRIDIGVILNPRRVTYASSNDAYTESRGAASEKDMARHKGSGLPKRPSVGKRFHGRHVLFDREDIIAKSPRGKTNPIGELVVKHWSYDTIVINTENNQSFSPERIREIINLAKSYGLKVIDGSKRGYI